MRGCACAAALWLGGHAVAQVAGPAATAPAATVVVQRFAVSGNTLLEPALVDATLAPFTGTRALAELRSAADALQRRYAQAGYGGVVAYLPPQSGADGVVAITVVEGKLSAVTISGNNVFDDDNVRASVPDLLLGATPRMRRIDGQIEMANENPSKRLQVLLKPGARTGDVTAELTVQDRPLQTMTFGVDDTGNSRTGRYRAGITWQYANISGHDDVLTAQYQTSPTKPGQVTVLTGAYRFPLPAQLAVIDAYAAYSNVDAGTTSTAAGSVSINGRGNLAGLRSSWYLPRWAEADQRAAVALDRREYINRCAVAGLPSAACGPAGSNVAVTPLSLEYSVRGNGPVAVGGSLLLMRNLPLGTANSSEDDFRAQRSGARRGYTALRATLSAATTVSDSWQLRARLAVQHSGDALVSGEQFGLGGANSVRGYEERELIGDRGASLALEVGGPELLTRDRTASPSLRPFAFADGGVVSNNRDAPCRETFTRCSVASVGLGLMGERDRLQARLAVAMALRDAAQTQRRDTRAHFAATVSF